MDCNEFAKKCRNLKKNEDLDVEATKHLFNCDRCYIAFDTFIGIYK